MNDPSHSPAQHREGIVLFSAFATSLGSLRFGGHLYKTFGTGFERHRVHGMFALVLVLGNGAYRDQFGTSRRVCAGDLIVVFPEVPHQYGPEAGDVWEELFVSFDGAAFEGWRAHGLDPTHPVWALPQPQDWAARFISILRLPVTNRPESCVAAAAIHLLIADALAARPTISDSHEWLESACLALSGGTGAPALQEIAKNLGLGYETFRKSFKLATGESPARYRRRMRLAQATLMIQRADMSLDTIAHALDFCDGFHLSKAFKVHYGYPPAQARHQGPKQRAEEGGVIVDCA